MPRRAPAKTGNAKALKIAYAALALSIVAVVVSAIGYTHINTIYINNTKTVYVTNTVNGTKAVNLTAYVLNNVTTLVPLHYLPGYPVINSSQAPGGTLNGINSPLNSTNLAVINNSSDSYFEQAGLMYLNGNLVNELGTTVNKVPVFTVNGKPSVIYLGSITCIFCGENRWAMDLALSRFGNFSTLFNGYSSIGDGDVPTLYWSPATYNLSAVDLGSFYQSRYLNFIVFEDTAPISGGFALQTVSQISQEVNASGNPAYIDAFKYIIQINNFAGTPYTIWGMNQVNGADAVDFGNNTQTAPAPLNLWTHAQVFSQLANPNNQFAWTEYAAADLYIAMVCPSLNSTAPPICQLPAIKAIEAKNGY